MNVSVHLLLLPVRYVTGVKKLVQFLISYKISPRTAMVVQEWELAPDQGLPISARSKVFEQSAFIYIPCSNSNHNLTL